MTTNQIIKSALKYNSRATALNFCNTAIHPGKWSIILGDNNLFWVVTNREASILMKSGYEMFI